MNRKTKKFLFCFLLPITALSLASPIYARQDNWTLGLIRRPISTIPAIQLKGNLFAIECIASSFASDWTASLSTEYISPISLAVTPLYDEEKERWFLLARIPSDIPVELYSLTVTCSEDSDTSKNAVKVLDSFPEEFYFVHLADCHTGQTPIAGVPIEKVREIFREINIINPEFVINGGDDTELGDDSQYREWLELCEQELKVPQYHIPGNHDFNHAEAYLKGGWYEEKYRARWENYMGPSRFGMERFCYSFDYGQYHFVGSEIAGYHSALFNVYPQDLSEEQIAWLRADLEEHQDSILKFSFAHEWEINNDNLEKICDDYNIPIHLWGHAHDDHVEEKGTTPTLSLRTWTAGSTHGTDTSHNNYRLIRIDGPDIVSLHYVQPPNSIPKGHLSISYSPENDGSALAVSATISNSLQEHFENAQVKFIMLKDEESSPYLVQGGTITQTVETADKEIVYVTTDVAANSVTRVDCWSESTYPPESYVELGEEFKYFKGYTEPE